MHLLYLHNGRFPSSRAHAVQIVKMCNAFVGQGLTVTLAHTDRPTDISEDPAEYYGEPLQFATTPVPVFDAVRRLQNMPARVKQVGFFVQRLSFFLRLPKLQRFDLIYGRDPLLLWLASFIVGPGRVCYESHDATYDFFSRRLFRAGARCVVISEGIRDAYVARGVSQDQLLVAHDGIDDAFFGELETKEVARQRLGLPQAARIAMYIGGFDTWKGVETFFAAAEHAPEISFVAIGGKPGEVEQFREKYPQVTFLGSRPYRELPDNQQAADVLVVPNTAKNELSATYTSPLKVFAHLASGVPLVLSDIRSLRNAVPADVAWWAVSDDPKEFAGVVCSASAHTRVTDERMRRATKIARQFTWDNRVKKVLSFVTEADIMPRT